MSLDKLREGLILRAREKARKIIENARKKAEEIVREAEIDYKRKLAVEREKALKKLMDEWNRKVTKELVEENLKLTRLKNDLVDDIVSKVRETIAKMPESVRRDSLRKLIAESLGSGVFPPGEELRVRVVRRDLELLRSLIDSGEFKGVFKEVGQLDDSALGGIIVETLDGSIAVDNTYSTRLERVKPVLVKLLNERVFKVGARGDEGRGSEGTE